MKKYKKNFNNLFDSICATLLFLIFIFFYCFLIYLGVINTKEGTNLLIAFICFTIIFLGGAIYFFCMLIWDGYSYWYLKEKTIVYKRLFRKKIIIPLSKDCIIKKKNKHALIFETYETDAYFFEVNNQTAIIYINDKNKIYLNSLFGEYINKVNFDL